MCAKLSNPYYQLFWWIFAGIVGRSNGNGDSKLPLILDYTMYLRPGESDWYYQEAEPGAVLFIDIEVVKKGSLDFGLSLGFSGNVGLAIKDPNKVDLVPYNWRTNASYMTQSAIGGYYSFQIDNKFSMFSSATVAVYISSYREDMDWGRTSLAEELEETTKNISKKLAKIEESVKALKSFLWLSRKLEKMDFAQLSGNQDVVTKWSLIQCFVIVMSGALHVYFVRRFFKTPSTKRNNQNQNAFTNQNSSNYFLYN